MSATRRPRVAMIGAGQLARMTHQAAVDYDLDLVVLAGSADDPAARAGAAYHLGSHTDINAIEAAAKGADVVTFDHELVPGPLLAELEERGHVLRPGRRAMAMSQDKLLARRALAQAGYPVPAFASVAGPADVVGFAEDHGWPVVLKARSGGYDGRGVVVLAGPGDVPAGLAWGEAEPAWLVEEHLDLRAELAVVVARRPSGDIAVYPLVGTTQEDGICRELVSPADLPERTANRAAAIGAGIAEHIGATGICAVELFVTLGPTLLVNELAVRPHNSGHASIEGNLTSQFHQHLRAILDWPLGSTDLVAGAVATVNLIADDAGTDPVGHLPAALDVQGAHVHLYGKASRPGRKIGHVTATGPTTADALATARRAADALLGR